MSNPRRAIEVFLSVAQMKQDPGPIIPHYATPLDLPYLYKWVPGSQETTNDVTVIGHTGGTAGRWLRVSLVDEGNDLTNADATLYVYDGAIRVLPVSTLSENRVLTLSDTGASQGDIITIIRRDTEAYTLQIDDEASSSTIVTLPASEAWSIDFRFNGSNFEVLRAGQLP